MIHDDFTIANNRAYAAYGLFYYNFVEEVENGAYGACAFDMDQKHILFRVAKITPTKNGQFVAFWKRAASGETIPYDVTDSFDFLIVSVRSGDTLGQFIFPQSVLYAHKVISKNGAGGKRAMRIYPPWDIPESPQAHKTQAWQAPYFVMIQKHTDEAKLKKLLL